MIGPRTRMIGLWKTGLGSFPNIAPLSDFLHDSLFALSDLLYDMALAPSTIDSFENGITFGFQ